MFVFNLACKAAWYNKNIASKLGHVHIGVIFLLIGNSQLHALSNSDWLFNTQSRVLKGGLLILDGSDNNQKATLHIKMPNFPSGRV